MKKSIVLLRKEIMNKLVVDLLQQKGLGCWNGYNGYNGGWPSARLFGWLIGRWLVSASHNKSISLERKRKSLLFCWERKSWTSWLLTCSNKKGWAAEKFSKKGENRKEKCFLSSQTRWSWQIKRACTSFWTCSSSPGHWSHTQELLQATLLPQLSKYARTSGLLKLRKNCLDRSKWKYRGTLIGIRSLLEKGVANQEEW